jgi:hypothetical protein
MVASQYAIQTIMYALEMIPSFTYIKLVPFYILQIKRHRLFPRIDLVDVTHSMGCQVDLPILLIWELIPSGEERR